MEDSKSVITPSDSRAKLPHGALTTKKNQKEKLYRELTGSIMYLTVATRPDISFVVNRLVQFNENYEEEHWSAVKYILRYLHGTQRYELLFRIDSERLTVLSNVDQTNDVNDRITYTGYVFNLSGTAITWH
ncbi:hypothetical protein J437_LFUL014423 [Ladona fulva]|uniref:Retrovirus-related Pol polyprotein from transposon TNT 1-94 n=1 Tax=Ladona fulva TaxID=123851 RepID=A0A8K0KJK4_LADFU|nr:hypothetical protein J437_LFUL014423 [Ladona fulva]